MKRTLLCIALFCVATCDAEPEVPTAERSAAVDPLLASLEPMRTRAGSLRFSTRAVHDPAAAAVFLHRLREGGEDEEVRRALVEALPRTGGDYGDALVDLLSDEDSAAVRVAMVGALRRAGTAAADTGLRLAIADRSPAVRAEAARVMGSRPDADAFEDVLADALTDQAPRPRAAAARSLGIVGDPSVLDPIAALWTDPDAEVRLEALRAASRIDPGAVRTRPDADALRDDPDPRVQRAAARLLGD
jgi:HEAT repeat protein